MDPLAQALFEGTPLFRNDRQSLIYVTLLANGPLGAENLHQHTGLHRETVQRELRDLEERQVVVTERRGRTRKAKAVPISALQEKLENYQSNFEQLLRPLLQAATSKKGKVTASIVYDSHAFALSQIKMLKLQPEGSPIQVLSVQPANWVSAMLEHRKLESFERLRLKKKVPFELLCFSELRGEIEENARKYFSGQPEPLRRKYRYIDSSLSSPLQIQVWSKAVVMSIFKSIPSVHVIIENDDIVQALRAYFSLLWKQN